jgi:hypothetical protein
MANQNSTETNVDKDMEVVESYMDHPRLQRAAQAVYNTVFEPINKALTWASNLLGPKFPSE